MFNAQIIKKMLKEIDISLTGEPLNNKVIIRRGGDSRRYEEKDIIKCLIFLNSRMMETIINKFEDKYGHKCVVFYKDELMDIFSETFYDVKEYLEKEFRSSLSNSKCLS